MKVLVDTSVWSLAFRKQPRTATQQVIVQHLTELIREMRVVMIGPIRQELLSGISDENKFLLLKENLRDFDDEPMTRSYYELAASFFNQCRRKGIRGTHIDFLICAVGFKNKFPVFTLDQDFEQYATCLNINIYQWQEDRRHV